MSVKWAGNCRDQRVRGRSDVSVALWIVKAEAEECPAAEPIMVEHGARITLSRLACLEVNVSFAVAISVRNTTPSPPSLPPVQCTHLPLLISLITAIVSGEENLCNGELP
jgi:hypothetical protein